MDAGSELTLGGERRGGGTLDLGGEPSGDGGVVRGGGGVDLPDLQAAARLGRGGAVIGAHLGKDGVVIGGVGHHGHGGGVLRGGSAA